ncbi:oxidoreductase [Luteitalea sp. TBR-22]|uniref:FAD-binding and (Fe-S)-binding domain-containing protein n=1 Tax=Luteitalea sp. TBR-22 TaxID=2802971 RepID=UPI001EF530A9|nr:FAD-binding and (Fe-S)-binding domain-containing protein [Luteitalea sp. TBR-22]BCS32443.2 oxidoreductase [Luteitalea sp. TBR-22]
MNTSVGSAPASLRRALEQVIAPERVLTRPIDIAAWASDASFYRPVPKAVVLAASVDEVRALFRLSHELGLPLTFRASGTSLSGQAVTDGILVEVKRHWRRLEVLDGGARLRVQPGVLGGEANLALRPFGRKIGPDPASLAACALGGILANNASGKCCGVAQNAYHTLDAITFLLPSGTVIDTAQADADARFRSAEPTLATGLLALKAEIEADESLSARIRAKYRMKNTTGYGLNAFLDFSRPVDIFAHLLIGSEGTLAFIPEAVLRTVPDLPHKATGLLLFATIDDACRAIAPLKAAGAKALELMDRASLRAVERQSGVPAELQGLSDGAAGLLVEFQAETPDALTAYRTEAAAVVAGLAGLSFPAPFTDDPRQIAALWRVREGMYPSVGAVRKSGTTVIIEDVAFPLERLGEAVVDLQALFARHGYPEAIIFGHAGDGNLHFVITQSFNDAAAIDQYARFMDDVVALVVGKYDGALKAEHGTGRNMAPFVEAEWGGAALAIMRRLKALADPDGLLNPGVIINDDPRAHLTDLKSLPSVEASIDTCVECGFCERVCPSRDLTLTPRQRILVRRDMVRREQAGESRASLDALWQDYAYAGLDTCAVDGMCATACPVAINTGALVKQFRHARHSPTAEAVGMTVATRFGLAESLVKIGLRLGHVVQGVLGPGAMPAVTRLARRLAGPEVPLWTREMPRPAASLPRTSRADVAAVYLPACVSRVFGHVPGEASTLSLPDALVAVAARAGRPVWIPDDVHGTCCGTPFSSKGLVSGHRQAANDAIERCWTWSQEGRLPIVVDANSCTLGLRECGPALTSENRARLASLRIVDSVAFARQDLLPRLDVTRRAGRVAAHPTCSLAHLGHADDLLALVAACAEHVTLPANAGCCGFAGDRGFLFPELTASATQREAVEVRAAACDDHVSANRMCEVALTSATGRPYRSVIHLLEEATR